MTNLQLTHLRFDAITTTDITLGGRDGGHYAGNNLRNALAAVLLRSVCPEAGRTSKPTPEHVATCPACWILAAETAPGSVVRPYTIIPPQPPRRQLLAGERFTFGLTIFGSGFHFLPHFVLSLAEVGEIGIGPGRGTFHIEHISAVNPFRQQIEPLLDPHSNLVYVPTLHVTWDDIVASLSAWQSHLAEQNGRLTLHFLTPLRLEAQKQLFRTPDFAILFQRLLYRLDDLDRHFAQLEHGTTPRRSRAEIAELHQYASQVHIVESRMSWHDLYSYSSRRQGKTPVGGMVGTAVYHTSNWQPLLPYLLFGQALHVGKLTIKGNGLYQLANTHHSYWDLFYLNRA